MIITTSLKNVVRLGASVSLGICGLVLCLIWPVVLDNLLTLSPNSLTYKLWKNIPIDIPTEVYFFNWTNTQDLHNLSIKPRFEEHGPYRFMQREEKTNITWNNNGTVTYKQHRFWFYDESPDNGNLQDNITSGDPLTLAAAYELQGWNYYIRKAIFSALAGRFPNMIRTFSVDELTFKGWPEPLIRFARRMPMFSDRGVPDWNRAGWLYARNDSYDFDGVFNVGTGYGTVFGQAYNWEFDNKTSYFDGKCGEITGSAGQFFPRNLQKNFTAVWSSDLRRTIYLTFEKEQIVNGILGYKFILSERTFDNGTLYPENLCFCKGKCIPSGMLNLSSTRWGAPLFVSLPHFHKADPSYIDKVDGLKPNPEQHEFYIIIEPTTGVPIKVDVKVQANMLIKPLAGVSIFDSTPSFYMPVVWGRQYMEIEGIYVIALKIIINLSTIFISLGTLMILGSAVLIYYIMFNKYDKYVELSRRRMSFKIRSLEEQRIPLNDDDLDD